MKVYEKNGFLMKIETPEFVITGSQKYVEYLLITFPMHESKPICSESPINFLSGSAID